MRFGVREICDVTFKALDTMNVNGHEFKAGQPVFMIETATTSTMEQGTTVVYAQGGKGNTRLISWEGEKTLTFTVTDALMSAVGMQILTGAGLIDARENKLAHFHTTYDVRLSGKKGEISLNDLKEELGLVSTNQLQICTDIPIYATVLDSAGSAVDYIDNVEVTSDKEEGKELVNVDKDHPFKFEVGEDYKDKTVKVDFYVVFDSGVKTIEIEPSSFGGYFYVEADTLFRNETTGKDMAASLIFPKVKVQSAFTFTMAASGDPSTFDFVMDAFPARTKFGTKKVLVDMQVIEGEDAGGDKEYHTTVSPDTHKKNEDEVSSSEGD